MHACSYSFVHIPGFENAVHGLLHIGPFNSALTYKLYQTLEGLW